MFNPQEKLKYDQIFDGLMPSNGLLNGDKVKPILLNSNLPVDVLGRVWELSDIDKDGFLDRDEFTVAMHLVYQALEKVPVPDQLPAEMVPPSKRHLPIPGLAPLLTTPLLPNVAAFAPGMPGNVLPAVHPASKIVISPLERANYDELFAKYDLDKDGFLNGADVKDVFLQTGLPQLVLAHIWNLCDTTAAGKLTKDQFALSMYLVQQKLKGAELPTLITQDMLPLSIQLPPTLPTMNMSLHMDQSTMKELEALSSEIEELKKEKMVLEQEKLQREADMRVYEGEMSNMQKDLDGLLFTMQQLECQKAEAQKKLDELEEKKRKLQTSVADCKEKYDGDQLKIQELRNIINNKKPQTYEEEMRQMRKEIEDLSSEERDLEKKYQMAINKEKKLNETLLQLEDLVSKSKSKVEDSRTANHEINMRDSSIFDANDVWKFPIASDQPSMITLLFNNQPIEEDPFASSDPFSNPLSTLDPFADDPFKEGFDRQLTGELTSTFNATFSQVPAASDPWDSTSNNKHAIHNISQLDPFGCNAELTHAFQHD
ncbi:hypothetical protein HELRODRAFT_189047, partial [Helobdella robusta]|uniref:Epidermal growth factor receptor substrate 15-like 1 n=1 Tax=Helobdella robusta TaxID=6412 RepID=T1FQL2_HELRO